MNLKLDYGVKPKKSPIISIFKQSIYQENCCDSSLEVLGKNQQTARFRFVLLEMKLDDLPSCYSLCDFKTL